MEEKSKLTSREYWGDQYEIMKKGKIFKINPNANLAVSELDKLFRKYLPIDKNKRFLEVGCAPGIWMDYFHRKFNYIVEGIEYTKQGFELTQINLNRAGTPNKIYNQDFFSHSLKNDYDVVFSGGFIEHFEDANDAVARHIDLLRDGGIAVIEIPNLSGWNGCIQRILNETIYKKHNVRVMNIKYFQDIGDKLNLEILYVGYVGKINFCLFQGGFLINLLLGFIQKFLTLLYLVFGKNIPISDSDTLSPFIVAIYKKK